MVSDPGVRELAVPGARLLIDTTLGGRAISWHAAGHELLAHHGDNPVEHGMYPMAPWAGRVRGNCVAGATGDFPLEVNYPPWAIHGTTLDQALTVESAETGAQRAELLLRMDRRVPDGRWPWPMTVDVAWILEPRTLTTRITVTADDEEFPCAVGWHPWFRRRISGASATWSMDAVGMLERDEHGLPAGWAEGRPEGPVDDAFLVPSGRATITWPSVVEVQVSADSEWFVVYDALPSALCVEPQTGPPDGLVDHPWASSHRARPGAPMTQQVTWTLRDLRDAGHLDPA